MLFLLALLLTLSAAAPIEPPKSATERQNAFATHEKYRKAGVLRATARLIGADKIECILAEWTYDKKGKESSIILYNVKNCSKTYITQTYDQHNNLELDANRNEDGLISEMNTLEYTENQFIKRVLSYDSSLRISGIYEKYQP